MVDYIHHFYFIRLIQNESVETMIVTEIPQKIFKNKYLKKLNVAAYCRVITKQDHQSIKIREKLYGAASIGSSTELNTAPTPLHSKSRFFIRQS